MGTDNGRFCAVFDEHAGDLWRFARRRCTSAHEADDIAAETFAVAWRRRDDLPTGEGARLWLLGTARRVLANEHRAAGRRDRLHRRVEVDAPTLAPMPDPADVVADRAGDRLLAALSVLRDDDRELLVMRAWDALTVKEIAELLEVTPNAVSVRLTRARGRLAAALDTADPDRSRQASPPPRPTHGGGP